MSVDSNRIRVEYIIDAFHGPYSGTEKQLIYLMENLDKKKYKFRLTVLRNTSYIESNQIPCEVTVLNIKSIFSFDALYKMRAYTTKLRNLGVDIAHIFFIDASIIAPFFLKICGIKTIISRRDMGYWYNPVNRKILSLNRIFVDGVITNCLSVKINTANSENIPPNKIAVIFNGHYPNTCAHLPVRRQHSELLQYIKKSKKRVIGIVANIKPIKRIDDLLKAFVKVRANYPDTVLVIAGDGNQSDLIDLSKNENIEKDVYFLGKIEDSMEVINQFNIGVICSDSEGLSNSIIEYMICKVPVVCTAVGGNSELIENGTRGFTVEVGDIDALAESICKILGDRDKAMYMAEKAYEYVIDNCNIEKMVSQHEKFYESMLNK